MSLYARGSSPLGGGGGGGGTPGGSNGQIQYNNGGIFGGDTSTTDGAGNLSATSLVASTFLSSPLLRLTGSATVSVQIQAGTSAYNFNLPQTAGTSGYFLTSAGGGSSPMTWTSSASLALSLGAFSSTPSAQGLTLAANVLNMDPADATHPGGVSTATQSFAGQKTFTTGLTGTLTGHATLDVATSSLGNLTDAGTDGIVVTGGTAAVVGAVSLAQTKSDATHNGYLSSTDWSTFNGKGSGSVTSVAMTVPTFLSISGSPITTSGTLALSLSGTALPVVNGGTGQTSLGNLTDVGTDGIVVTGGTGALITSASLAQHVADTTHNGYLSSTDWNTFNGKGAGSVTSVGLSVPATSIFGTTGTPVTTSGTLGLTTTGTSGGIPYFSSTSALSTSAALTVSQLIVGGGAGGAPVTLAAGSNTNVLTMVGGVPAWAAPATAGTVTSVAMTVPAFLSVSGSPVTSSGTLAVTLSGTALPIANGGTGQTTATAAFGALSPLTTKGDILAYDTANNRLPIGTDGTFHMPDSNQTLGMRYANVPNFNLLQINSDAEVSVGGWAAFSNAAANIPTSGTGGSPASTITRTTTAPLSGTGSFLWTKSANNRQGEGAACAFSVPSGYQGQVINYRLLFKVASGTFVASDGVTAPLNDGTTTTNAGNSDLEVFFYDVTNSVLLYPTPSTIISTSTVGWIQTGTVQLPSNSTSYRIIVYQALAGTTAYTAQFDDVYIGLQPAKSGPPISDWIAFTPTGAWSTNTSYQGFYRRNGDSMDLQYYISLTGAPTSASLTINLPSGFTVNTAKLPSTSTNNIIGNIQGKGAAHNFTGFVTPNTSTTLFCGYTADGSTTSIMALLAITQAAPYTFANADFLAITVYDLPIAGWSSNTAMSSDASTRLIAAQYTGNGGTAITANVTNIDFITKVLDTSASFSSNTTFTAPVSGWYDVKGSIALTGSATPNFFIYVNTVSKYNLNTSASNSTFSIAGGVYLNAGDAMTIRSDTGSITLINNATKHWIGITQNQGPSNIAVVDSVRASYQGQPTGTLTSAFNKATIPTKISDSHNAFSSGVYTCPISGAYLVSAQLAITESGVATGSVGIQIAQAGSASTTFQSFFVLEATITGVTNYPACTGQLQCVAGDTITISGYSDGTSTSYSNSASRSNVSIARVGN